eukprot:TRINITY_DN17622_c0_g1_i1.p1 TRINITY_DN17622_c0_g1~~TRINITY_DN17622_c0_g1_i1.p1  ORF type:complete len:420 (-),score=120.50 TRINITY_DN17622_c0_g1_i1:52-1236(-)
MGRSMKIAVLFSAAAYAQDTNSLLNDLRNIQFPPSGGGLGGFGAGQQQQAPMGGGMGFGGGAFGMGGLPPLGAAGGGTLPPMGGFGGNAGMPAPGGFSGLGGAGGLGSMGAMGGMGGMPAAPQASGGFGGAANPAMDQIELPHDLGCTEGPRKAAWASAKATFRSVFGEAGAGPFEVVDMQVVMATLQAAMQELTASGALAPNVEDQCGQGRLFLTMLSMMATEQPLALLEALGGVEQLASPVLTLMLDIPWIATAQAGWPFFGLMAQLSMRAQTTEGVVNPLEADGLDTALSQQFFQQLAAAVPSLDVGTMAQASVAYTEQPPEGNALSLLTAMAAQAAVMPLEERARILQSMQQAFKQVVQGSPQLVAMLTTRWPLWSLLHLAVTPIVVGEA